jgi:tRNA A37 threonylcarbamoyladenosine dehydratase
LSSDHSEGLLIPTQFHGIVRLYGLDGFERLRKAHVCVAGIGGVGSWAAESLGRTGIGQITLIDMDDVCVSNVNRQIHALSSTVGRPKIEVMAERLRDINPDCVVHCVFDFLNRENLPVYLHSGLNFVVDAIDNATVKSAMIAWCQRRKIRIITTGAAGGQIDPTQIVIGDLNKTVNDPLARKVRAQLRRLYHFSRNPARTYGIPCVYSTEQLRYPTGDGAVCFAKTALQGDVKLDCGGGLGSVSMVTAAMGMAAAARVVQKLALPAKPGQKVDGD